MTMTDRVATAWPSRWDPSSRALAVIAHPDDESFGLGAVLAALVEAGVGVPVLCLTHGLFSGRHMRFSYLRILAHNSTLMEG